MNQSTARVKGTFFYGWVIVAVSTLALLVSNGLAIGGMPVFFKPIQDNLLEIGTVTLATKDAVTGLAAGLTFLVAGIFSLFVGLLIKRLKLKLLMAAGCIVLGIGLVIYSNAASPVSIYLSHSLFGLSLGLVGVMAQTVLIANWFRRQRGAAMGIVLSGTSLGGMLISPIAGLLIKQYGWRTAMLLVSLLVWAVLLPAILLLVRDRASDLNLNVDGDDSNDERNPKSDAQHPTSGMTFGEALRSPSFWVLSLCAAAIFYPIFATSQQFVLYVQNPRIGFDATGAAWLQSFLFVMSAGGKFLFGWLSDKLPTARVMLICCGVMFGATLVLLGFLTADTIYLYLIPFGLGYGGTFVLIQLLAVENFGLRDIGKILGALTLIETIGGFVGSVVTGRLASANNGDYTIAFYGVTVAAGLSLLCVVALNFLAPRKEISN